MSQLRRLRAHLERGKRITPAQALKWFGIGRLAARIDDLKHEGLAIHAERKKVKTRAGHAYVAEYSVRHECGAVGNHRVLRGARSAHGQGGSAETAE
jgi:hypothetical protein